MYNEQVYYTEFLLHGKVCIEKGRGGGGDYRIILVW